MSEQMYSAGLTVHPLRESLYAELHSRPFHVVSPPAAITQISVMMDRKDKAKQFQHLCELCQLLGLEAPDDLVFIELYVDGLKIRRERHVEFTTYTFINTRITENDKPFSQTGISHLPEGWLERLPGLAVAAFHVYVQQSPQNEDLMLPTTVREYFEGMRLVGSSPQNGDAQVWTTFQLHSDGFGRFLVYNNQMSDSQLGRMIQRVMEIESYRLMALLALPVARSFTSVLAEMDTELAEITSELASSDTEQVNEQEILGRLTDMAAMLEACRSESTFRFLATDAYHQIVLSRLEELKEDEVSGHLTMNEFMTRRLSPAVRTCNTVAGRLENLSRRIDRVSDMMRTRVELSIHAQNKDRLSSMDRRSQVQMMMQHTVEGLSVAAISYYAVGLVKYLLEALYGAGIKFDKSLTLGIAVPIVIMLVWFFTRRIHKHFLSLAHDKVDADNDDTKEKSS